MRKLLLVALMLPVVACAQGKPVQLGGKASGASSAGPTPKPVPLSGTATATSSAKPTK